MVEITDQPIDHARTVDCVRTAAAGAVVSFLGTTRQLTGGRQTASLDYEAYPRMAEAKLREIEAEARDQWPIAEVAIVHRVGHLEIGDISVVVAVSSPHRAEAFQACQYIMDRIKAVVPIWKRENWTDGESEWVHPGLGLTGSSAESHRRGS